uniref:Uncharacterized protein n=1 Tax=Arundo donax TaxID=35708 RepID=A0A0A9HI76_ARUDO
MYPGLLEITYKQIMISVSNMHSSCGS